MAWTESTSEQVLVLSWLRTEGELTQIAGNLWVLKALLFNDLSLPTPPYARKSPNRVRETRGAYVVLD
jgi:hypothetical protein